MSKRVVIKKIKLLNIVAISSIAMVTLLTLCQCSTAAVHNDPVIDKDVSAIPVYE